MNWKRMLIFSIALLILVNQVYSKAFLNQNSNFFNNPSDNQLKLLKKIFSQKSNDDYRFQGSETEENAPLDDYSVDNENEQINELKRKYDSAYETSINLKKSNKFHKTW